MEEGTFRRYPIGIQDFEDLRNNAKVEKFTFHLIKT